jgi:diadenosine tetraphosphatase ApaH/serine/threonine PP2A family protein phosphatase
VYSNYRALRAVLDDTEAAGAEAVYCLGDVGAFGPHPDRAVDMLREAGVTTIQGNYDDSVGRELEDCQCGYTDPRDNHYARISYEYTLQNTSKRNRRWLDGLPSQLRLSLGGQRVLMAHGSPRRVNEFLWESTTPVPFIRRLLREYDTDLILVTHTGLHWHRFLPEAPGRGVVNVGAIGRPDNDGDPAVHYALLRATGDLGQPVSVEMRRIEYDHGALAEEMRAEGLPEEFVETILTGWWTCCLEQLPAKERARSRF